MEGFNAEQKVTISEQWKGILAAAVQQARPSQSRAVERRPLAPSQDFDEAMRSLWQMEEPLPPDPGWKCSPRNTHGLQYTSSEAPLAWGGEDWTPEVRVEEREESEPSESVHPAFLLVGDFLHSAGILSANNEFELRISNEQTLCVGKPASLRKAANHTVFLLNQHNSQLCMYRGTRPPPGNKLPPQTSRVWCMQTCSNCALHVDDHGKALVHNGTHWRSVLQGKSSQKTTCYQMHQKTPGSTRPAGGDTGGNRTANATCAPSQISCAAG